MSSLALMAAKMAAAEKTAPKMRSFRVASLNTSALRWASLQNSRTDWHPKTRIADIPLPVRILRKKRRLGKKYQFKTRRHEYMAILRRVTPKGLPLKLAAAVVTVESGWRPNLVGGVGEIGLMQLRPTTAKWMGDPQTRKAHIRQIRKKLYNPEFNLRIGTRYLHWCYKLAKRDIAATIGCYNRGPGRMWKWHKNKITKRYVSKVRRLLRSRRFTSL